MPDFSEYADKAKEFASEHPEQADEALQRAGDFADQRTGGRFSDQIQQGEQRADEYLGAGGQGDTDGQDQGGQDQYGQDQGGQDQGGQDQGGQDDQGQGGAY